MTKKAGDVTISLVMTVKLEKSSINPLFFEDTLSPDNRYPYQIPVDVFSEHYNVKNPEVLEVLQKYPTLCYLLGRVTDNPQGEDSRPDNVLRPYYLLKEGSAMFALENKNDAKRWSGIFNHIMGTARQVHYLAEVLSLLPEEKIKQFADFGLNISSFKEINSELLRDFMFVSHSGRRKTDEKVWHNLNDTAHCETDPGKATLKHLYKHKAPPIFLALMRTENHEKYLAADRNQLSFPNFVDNILTYCDWTFGQTPNTLVERFASLRKSQRAKPETLDILEKCGNNFENALKQIVNPDIWQKMTTAGPFNWETEIRAAYCTPSGLSLEETFPHYVKQFPNAVK